MTIPIPEGSVVITPIEVYREVQATHQAVQQLLGKLDTFVGTQSDHENRIRKLETEMPDNAETRLRHLENRIAMYAGSSAAAGMGIGWLVQWAIYGHH